MLACQQLHVLTVWYGDIEESVGFTGACLFNFSLPVVLMYYVKGAMKFLENSSMDVCMDILCFVRHWM